MESIRYEGFWNHFIQSINMTIKAQDEWNEIQTWSQPQLITNQYYEHINMVVMRYTYMSKKGGKHENYDANGVWHGTNMLLSSLIQWSHGLSHTQDKTSIGYEINGKLYQMKPIEYDNMIISKDVTNTKFHQAL